MFLMKIYAKHLKLPDPILLTEMCIRDSMDTIHGDYKYFSVITDEISKLAVKLFPLSEKREDNFVAGFSMGGYGAFKWAMHNPEKFRCCGVFSGPIGIVPHERCV